MRFLHFNGSAAKILLPSAEDPMSPDDALDTVVEGEELSSCVVSGLDLSDQHLELLALRNCILENANLANTRADEVRLDRVVITDSTLIGFQPRTMTLKGCLLDTCRLNLASLAGLRVIELSAFVGCSMHEVDLSGADTREAIFHDCDLTGADLTAARLDGADLRGSRLTGAHGLATVRRAVLSPDQLADLLVAVQRELGLRVDDSEPGPVVGWREAPER